MFLQIAIAAIGIGVVIMVGYIVINEVKTALLPTITGNVTNGTYTGNLDLNQSLNSSESTIFSGFSLIVIGIIVMAAFGLVSIFR